MKPYPERLLALVLAPLALVPPATAWRPAPAQDEVRWEPHTGRGRDGATLEGRVGRLTVRADRDDPDGGEIELAFVHYPSRSARPGPPIYFLAGGPGAPGIGTCEYHASAPDTSLLDFGDVVALDQRGTGRSVPDLSSGPETAWELPLDEAIGKADVVAAEQAAIATAAEYWAGEGVDLTDYTTAASADDLDAVRRALGHERIVLFGSSYGSHLGLAYLRRHGRHVARAVLSKVEGPDHTWKLPSRVQARLEHLGELVAADPVAGAALPDLVGAVRALRTRLEAEPVLVTLGAGTPGELQVRCGAYELQRGLGMLLDSRAGAAQAVVAVAPLVEGDFEALGRIALRVRRGGDASMMAYAMDCASGASPTRRARIAAEAADPRNVLADTLDGYFAEFCEACGAGDVGAAFRGPLECDVPTLFVSGTLDARTPPSNVDDLLPGFSRALHVVVEHAGHPPEEYALPEFRLLLEGFLAGDELEPGVVHLALPPVEFVAR